MKNIKMRARNAAFTLYELVIVMALSLLVVGLVTSYIIFANGFTKRSEAAYERVEQFTRLREEIDTWFSFADNKNYDIIISGTEVADAAVPLVQLKYRSESGATNGEVKYIPADDSESTKTCGIYMTTANDTSIVTFYYPEKGKSSTVTCKYITDINFYKYDNNTQSGETDGAGNEGGSAVSSGDYALRFTIKTIINEGVYACEFLYEEN